MLRYRIALAAVTVTICAGISGHALSATGRAIGDLNPKAITITLPADIKWTKTATNERAVLYGDPSKPGYYVVHTANEYHYDGAKDEPALLQISGMGPDTNTPAPQK